MHDWHRIVRGRLAGTNLNLSACEYAEVVGELAGHVEEAYETLRESGISVAEAEKRVLEEAGDWSELARGIRHSKAEVNNMSRRTKTLWLPGLFTLATVMALLNVLTRTGWQPRIIWINSDIEFALYLPWLAVLPLFGAMGAWWSLRAGGRRLESLISALFPTAAFLGVFCLILPVSLIVDGHEHVMLRLAYWATALCNWVILPGVVLLLGALPVLKLRAARPLA